MISKCRWKNISGKTLMGWQSVIRKFWSSSKNERDPERFFIEMKRIKSLTN